MDLQLEDRICLVTGASAGIGRATALALAAEGAQVVITARSSQRLRHLATEIGDVSGRQPFVVAADLLSPGGPKELARAVLARFGHVDVVVNNAGASRPVGLDASEKEWSDAFQLGYTASRHLVELLVPGMRERGWGRVVNLTGAIVAKTLNASAPPKAALESWAKALSGVLAPEGITVNCVAPGRVESDQIMNRVHPTEASRRDYIDRNIPAGRFGTAEEAAALILFLVSGPASYITGATIPVDGGAMRLAF